MTVHLPITASLVLSLEGEMRRVAPALLRTIGSAGTGVEVFLVGIQSQGNRAWLVHAHVVADDAQARVTADVDDRLRPLVTSIVPVKSRSETCASFCGVGVEPRRTSMA